MLGSMFNFPERTISNEVTWLLALVAAFIFRWSSVDITFFFFFHPKCVESLENISGNKIFEIIPFLDHQHNVIEGIIKRTEQSSNNNPTGNVFGTEGNQFI